MSKYTRGPWRAEISCDETGAPQKCWWISAKGDVDIGETSGEKRSDEEAANALLIAAAPDLLEACKDALAFVEELDRRGIAQEWSGEGALRAAIEKAEGVADR